MKILVIDGCALALDFCLRAMEEGHELRWFIRDDRKDSRIIGTGMVPKVNDWKPSMGWADLVFLPDNSVYMRDLEAYHRAGYPIYGANDWTARMELERGTGMEVFDEHKIKTLPGECFTNYDKAIDYVKSTLGRYVSKPSGDADRALSYVSKGPDDMVFMLQRWKKLGKMKAPFILQKFMPGIEMAVGAWIGQNGWSSPWCENWEFKKLMPGDLGVATGEQGTVCLYSDKSKLADKVLDPLEDYLVSRGHLGYVDVNCIIDDKGTPWPLEFTMRPGWPTFNIQQRLHRNTAAWMLASLDGRNCRSNFETGKIASGVVVSIPDYPYSHLPRREVMGTPIYNYEPNRKNVHLCEAMKGTAPVLERGVVANRDLPVSAGNYLLVTSGTAQTVQSSVESAYQTAQSLRIPNSPAWRNDIGLRLKKQLPLLQSMGYARSIRYQ
jgi:phosphoribosylamine--glycine ligase